MKKTLLILFLTGCVGAANAQIDEPVKSFPIIFSVGPEIGFPVGNNTVEYSLVFGGSAQAEYDFTPEFGVTLNAGYLSYSFKNVRGKGDQGFVPLLAGLRYFISPRAFVFLKAGAAFGLDQILDATNNVYLDKGTFFAYSPGIGHKFGKKIEGEFKFLGISNSSHQHINSFQIKLAYIL